MHSHSIMMRHSEETFPQDVLADGSTNVGSQGLRGTKGQMQSRVSALTYGWRDAELVDTFNISNT